MVSHVDVSIRPPQIGMVMNIVKEVFIDGRTFGLQRQGGISRLFFELSRCLSRRPEIRQSLYRGFHLDDYPFERSWFQGYWGLRRPLARGYGLTDRIEQPLLDICYNRSVRRNPGTIFHASYYRLPTRSAGPRVVHVYDMIHEKCGGDPATVNRKHRAIHAADLIFAISKATADDVSAMLSIPMNRIRIAYPGVSPIFLRQDTDECAELPELVRPFVLYVGQRGWYKNFILLLKTFVSQALYEDFDLAVVGGEATLTAAESAVLARARRDDWLKFLRCGDEQLARLYRTAFAYVCTSQQEGFGIPLVEAMACGCPVIAADTSSIPEVVGDAGLRYVSGDQEALSAALLKLRDDTLFRDELVRRGRERAAEFTWEKMAETIVRGYGEL